MTPRRLALSAAALVVVVAVIAAVVIVHAGRSQDDRLAGWVGDTGCPKVIVTTIHPPAPKTYPDDALLDASTSATDFECFGPNGDVDAYHFAHAADITAALARFHGTSPRRVCVAGRTVIASHLLGGPRDALARWCEELSGTLQRV